MAGPTADATGRAQGMANRPRRPRRTEGIRSLVRETVARPDDLIDPLFVVPQRAAADLIITDHAMEFAAAYHG